MSNSLPLVSNVNLSNLDLEDHLRAGPVAIVFIQDDALVDETFERLVKNGFKNFIAVGTAEAVSDLNGATLTITVDPDRNLKTPQILNILMPSLDGRWVYHCQNAEFLFFPFCEGRNIADLICFADEERRPSVFATTVDLYCKGAPNIDGATIDSGGFYSMVHTENGHPADRQIDVFGGLRWRHSDHFENHERVLNRNVLFKAHSELELAWDYRFNDPEYNTISCPWHHNVTICVASYWAYKRLTSDDKDTDFTWFKSQKFDWSSTQLMLLGFMEPGQWF